MAEELPLAAGYRYPPSARHTCCHCETIIIDPASADADVLPPDEFRNSFRFSMEAAFQAYRDGCLVFRRIILDTIYTRRDIFKSCLRSQLLSSFPRREASIPLLRITIDVLGAGISEARSKYCWVDDDNVSMSGDTRYAGHYMIDCEHEYPCVEPREIFDFVRGCRIECNGHPDCVRFSREITSMTGSKGPSRLVFVGAANPRIVSLTNSESNLDYLALSYCWGGDDSMKLTTSTIGRWTESLPFTELPKTLRDAITFTKHIGLEYVWIDRLCIIQDDPEDVIIEIAAMPNIYGRAWLTLSVSWAKASQDGFLFSTAESHNVLRKTMLAMHYRCPDESIGLVTLTPMSDWTTSSREAIDYRAWTLQEQMLSPRVLQFSSHYVRWDCKSARYYYRHSENPELPIPKGNFDTTGEGLKEWRLVVEDYCSRKMSDSGDKLLAISAIAANYHRRQTGIGGATKYMAGLWEEQLPEALLWRIDMYEQPPRPPVYRAPSWSWASIDGRIFHMFLYRLGEDRQYNKFLTTVTEWRVELTSQSAPYGAVASGFIKLRGQVRLLYWHLEKGQLSAESEGYPERSGSSYATPDALDNKYPFGTQRFGQGAPVLCLLLGYSVSFNQDRYPFGLILVPETEPSNLIDLDANGEFGHIWEHSSLRRVGFFDIGYGLEDERKMFWELPYKELEVTII